ncbi:MAG TPA: AAA family ATPase [Rhodopila sp.]
MRRPPNLMKGTITAERPPAPPDPAPPTNYLDFYGLSKSPFAHKAEAPGKAAAYILFSSHRRAFELLMEHVVNGSGVILLQGEEGIGKTETLRSAASAAAEAGLRTIVLSRPPNGRISVMQIVSAMEGKPSTGAITPDQAIAHFLRPPRKALLVDDVDLMSADCVRLLLSLAQRLSNDPGGSAIVLTTTTELAADPERPELSQLVGLARNTIRLTRLGTADIRQYIERSLWIAGGTTRRLISPDAIKLVIAQSGGVPGMANRLMDALLTAGFARGDAMITAKTVAATIRPSAPRRQPREPRTPNWAGRAVPIASVAVLVLGASVFLYQALNSEAPNPVPPSPKPAAAPSAPSPGATPDRPAPTQEVPPALVTALMKHGDQSLTLGDIAAARLLYQRAAEAGSAAAATALGRTYDPNYATPGQTPDPARAAEWYNKAMRLGDSHAADLLKRLASRQGIPGGSNTSQPND